MAIGRRKIILQFSVNWLATIGVLALGLVAAFVLEPLWRPVLIFTAPVLGGAAALVAAFNAIEARSSQTEQSKKAEALRFIHRWLDPQLYHAKRNCHQILQHFKDHHRVEDQKAFLDGDSSRQPNLFDILNLFEAMSIAIQEGMADEVILKRFFRSILLQFWHISEAFVRARRAERENTRLLQEVEVLFVKWRA